jgi:hypothetical protein
MNHGIYLNPTSRRWHGTRDCTGAAGGDGGAGVLMIKSPPETPAFITV